MIHRPFLFRSFQEPQYAYTRKTCVSAASTILRTHQQIIDADDISIWTHSAFCITAAMVIGLELVYPRGDNTEKRAEYWLLITAARDRLNKRQGDIMADRGVRLIDTVLQEADRSLQMQSNGQDAEQSRVDFRKVLDRFLTLDDRLAASSAHDLDEFRELDFDMPLPDDDFDVWLNQVFGSDPA